MKTKIVLVMLCLIWIFAETSYGDNLRIPPPASFTGPKFQVEETVAEVFSDNSILVVRGKVRNLSYQGVKGYVIIYLQGASHNTLGTVEAAVNDNYPFKHGTTGAFEVSANIKGISEIRNVSIEFVTQ